MTENSGKDVSKEELLFTTSECKSVESEFMLLKIQKQNCRMTQIYPFVYRPKRYFHVHHFTFTSVFIFDG